MAIDLTKLSVASVRKSLDAKEFTALELTECYLKEIEKKNPELHAYLEVWPEDARADAKRADQMIAEGKQKSLTGIPLALKDNILVNGHIASSGSKMLENYRASYDATVITKLKAEGAVLLGRTNMDEFALGSSTENSAFGPSKNPHDLSRVPGGTSGGSAAAVAGNLALVALGSDTGGSVRQPAAFCGVVGLKPTYGEVSRSGLMAAASSLDQIGTLGKTVADAEAVFRVIRGNDGMDGTSLPDAPLEQATPKKIGVPRAFLQAGIEPDVLKAFDATLAGLTKQGYTVVDIDLPRLKDSLAVYYIINPAEVSTNLARYDGIRYGLSVPAEVIQEVYTKSKSAGFGAETRRRILVGTFVLSSGYADAYYRKAKAVRELLREDFAKAFASVDTIALPTTPTPAFKIGKNTTDPLAMYLEDICTVPINLVGVPALSVPSGHVVRDGVSLPLGFQLIASHRKESTLFTVARAVEELGL